MSANNLNGLRLHVTRLAVVPLICLGLAAPSLVRAEVGIALQTGTTDDGTVYVLDGATEDPGPINTVWRRLGTDNTFRVELNTNGELNNDGSPSLLSDPASGLIAAAWSRNSANGYDVVISRFASGTWSPPQVVVGGSSNELDPKLVIDAGGNVHLYYWVDTDPPQVFQVVAPNDLSSWSAPLRISEISEPSLHPSGGIGGGFLRVAYEVHNFGTGQAPREVVLARFENGAFIPDVVAITNNLGTVRPEVHSHAGRLWVDWIDFEDGTGAGELAWTRLNSQGQWEAIRYEPFGNYGQREYLVRGGARMKAIAAE